MAAGREELYNATELIAEPKITQLLSGSYRTSGPPEVTEQDIKKNMSEKKTSKPSMKREVHTRVESGTCNVCSTPCSSCMHLKLSSMESKGVEYSDENCRVTATSQNSVFEDDVLPFNDAAYDSLRQNTSEASNLLSVNSSYDSLSENVDSKTNIRSSDVADVSAESTMLLKTLLGGGDKLSAQVNMDQKIFSNKHEHPKTVEGHDDNMSFDSRANDVFTAASQYNKNVDNKDVSCSSALVSSLGQERLVKARLLPPKSGSLEMPSNNADAGGRSPKAQSRFLSSLINGQHSKEGTELDTCKVSSELCTKLDIEPRTDADHQADGGSKYYNRDDKDEKSNLLVELPETQEPALQSVSGDDSDESELVEHDVKVCDICGDAGREDLLAICSKCSDGAEHTYCMREMLQKVPEGDWLCEECKLAEETDNQKQGSDAERMNNARQGSIKRLVETNDMAPPSKRQAVETNLGSPKSSSPTKQPSLSRNSSLKGLDKGKVKLAHQTSFSNHTGFDSTEIARSSSIASRLQPSKSALLKSNSFNTMNSKPKLKLVDEVPQKPKDSRDPDMKEGSGRMMSKSMSFRSVNSVHSRTTDSKVKMLSPRFSQFIEMKGLKQVKERGAFESKSLSKSVTTSSSVSVPKVNQKLTPRGESSMTSSTSNNKEPKASQSDSQSGLLRSNSIIARKGADNPGTSVRSVEKKLNQVTPMDEPSSNSWTAERPSSNLDENLQDGSSRSRESSSQSEKTRESSDNRSKPAVAVGLKNLACRKCKETGHTTESCSAFSPRASDTSSSRSVKGDMSKGSKLKAAIEAAMLKKPGIFRKKKESDQSDGLSSSTMDTIFGKASNDQLSSSNKTRHLVSDEGEDGGQTDLGTCPLENSKQININNMKQANVLSGEVIFPSKSGDLGSMVMATHALAGPPLFPKTITIPEHECIWQGAFEIRKGEKVFDLYGGVQAHLSTSASPKVLEVVNQFPHKINLDEVPRLSAWPSQFHDNGPKEHNIALYFFAKDLESYEKSYKNLLDNMIKRDLALKGCFDGIDFLIFPSTQLPENSQRWNMLFFLWGVFWGRRSNCPDSIKNLIVPNSYLKPLDMHIPDKTDTSLTGDFDSKVSNFETNSEKQDGKFDSIPSLKGVTGNTLVSSEIRRSGTSQEEAARSAHEPDLKNPLSFQATKSTIASNSRRMYIAVEKAVDRMEVDRDEALIERNPNNDPISMDLETSSRKGLEIKQLSSPQLNNRKRPILDLEVEVVDISDDNDILVDSESLNKKLKSGFSENYSRGKDSYEVCEEKVIREDVGASERYFFPVDSREGHSMIGKESSSNDENLGVPNLELALGAETKPPQSKGIIAPLFIGPKENEKEEEDVGPASLSLSLSFPFPEKEQNNVKSVTKKEQLLPERRHVNTSLLLFGGFPDK